MSAIEFEELRQDFDSFILIDVRKPEEIAEDGKLPGAFNIPLQELEKAISLSGAEFFEKYGISNFEDNVKSKVVYCRSGRRVGLAQEILSKNGYANHRLYFGSFLEWAEKGGEIEFPEYKKQTTDETISIEAIIAIPIEKFR